VELKVVNFARIYHECAVFLALSQTVDLFIKNVRHYEFPDMSYIGLRYRSAAEPDAIIDSLNVRVGASPFDRVFKLEVSGSCQFHFFANPTRRVVAGIGFESPILNGDGFFAQFWPGKMIYDIALDYEKKIASGLFAVWTNHYRLDMPVDEDLPFAASLFTGLALRNQANFDELGHDFRYELAVGYDFKRGLEFDGHAGMGIWKNSFLSVFSEIRTRVDAKRIRCDVRLLLSVFSEIRTRVDAKRIRCDVRLLAGGGTALEVRPYIGWKKDIGLEPGQDTPGKFLFGLGFFKKF